MSLEEKHLLSAVRRCTAASKVLPGFHSDALQSRSSFVPDGLAIMDNLTASPLVENSRQGLCGMECQVS